MMRTIEDLITDVASIVTSCRPGELMTVKKIEEEYRAIYRSTIPYNEFGFSSLERLLEAYQNNFNFSTADGNLIIRTSTKTNITELISKEKPKKPNSSLQSSQTNSLFKKHRRKEMYIEPQLPVITVKNIESMLNSELRPIKKDVFLHMFEEIHGYRLNYLDYGFVDLDHLLRSLHGKSLMFVSHLVFPMKRPAKSIYDLIKQLLATETGFSVSVLQERLAQLSDTRVSELMKAEGFVNFIDVIYDAASRQMLLFDYELVYPFSERAARRSAPFPRGPNEIRVLSIHNPHEFYFQVLRDRERDGDGDRDSLETRLQQSSPTGELLAMFREHPLCAFDYDGVWHRAVVTGHGQTDEVTGTSAVTLRFIDRPIEVEQGVQVALPTDRLRFMPAELETVPASIYRGRLAYISPLGGPGKWNRDACERFADLVTRPDWRYRCFVVLESATSVARGNRCFETGVKEYEDGHICIDLVATDELGQSRSIFHELIRDGVVAFESR